MATSHFRLFNSRFQMLSGGRSRALKWRARPLGIALQDLAGIVVEQPCRKMIGGLSRTFRVYASSGAPPGPAQIADATQASRQGLHRDEDPDPPRRLTRRRQGAGSDERDSATRSNSWSTAIRAGACPATFAPHARTNDAGIVADAHLTARVADAPFPLFPHDSPQWDVDRRDYIAAKPLKVDGAGNIVLTDRSGVGCELAEDMPAKTRAG
jgi:L-alanine-DL-glutamate epimerase-like enolase superfamily enzyme